MTPCVKAHRDGWAAAQWAEGMRSLEFIRKRVGLVLHSKRDWERRLLRADAAGFDAMRMAMAPGSPVAAFAAAHLFGGMP